MQKPQKIPKFLKPNRTGDCRIPQKDPRACLKKAFCKMYVTICGRFCLIEGGVAGYANRKTAKYTAKWGMQIAGMIFQTRSSSLLFYYLFCANNFPNNAASTC